MRRYLIPGRQRRWSDVRAGIRVNIALNKGLEVTQRIADDIDANLERMEKLVSDVDARTAERDKAAREARQRLRR